MEQLLESSVQSNNYLIKTRILNYDSPIIQTLINEKGWREMSAEQKVLHIYNFVRDEIKFGYNLSDNIPASQVLQDGYGQCNTKANLFMALLRAVNIPNRIHGFTIDKALQKGAITGIWYKLSPQNILHSWVEVWLDNEWYNLEGLILDKSYLQALQQKFADCKTTFCGYGAYTDNFQEPPIDWNFNNTYIQNKGINQDFGLFDTPDDFYQKHQQKLGTLKKWIFENWVRHLMNRNVNRVRGN
ncbi:transglutaminase-like domain-containing protein [Fulvivirga ligni]|uniref:transglutaminase-like domain-containing protein n=1 Tax=Fulvivirga ligni TaxID=2904246 RepID=UPI001F3A4ECF|nr:transglutaminase-like domain-containing protein [Fulvivirga ligni]UII24272.1 transglutaminase-like domain-containing protein [Fulvivirga ligni]